MPLHPVAEICIKELRTLGPEFQAQVGGASNLLKDTGDGLSRLGTSNVHSSFTLGAALLVQHDVNHLLWRSANAR